MPVILPERTIDAWTTIEIEARVDRVLIWAPSQPRQQISPTASGMPGREPWDLIAKALHVFALENKSLAFEPSGWGAWLNENQHWAMLRLETMFGSLAHYVLPAPNLGLVQSLDALPAGVPPISALASLRTRPGEEFAKWARVLLPSEVSTIVPALPQPPTKLTPPKATKRMATLTKMAYVAPARTFVGWGQYATAGESLGDFLDALNVCDRTPSMEAALSHLRDSDSRPSDLVEETLPVGRLMWAVQLAAETPGTGSRTAG